MYATDRRQTDAKFPYRYLFCILLTFKKCILYFVFTEKQFIARKCSIWKDWPNRIGGCNFAVDKEHGHNTLLYGVDACALTKAVYV